jgi:chromosome segregation ATPase
MGNYFSKTTTTVDTRYNELQQQLDGLFARLDANHDNVVTQDEMEAWTQQHKRALGKLKQQKKDLQAEIKEIQDAFRESLSAKDLEIQRLQSELTLEKQHREQLESQNRQLIRVMDEDDDFGLHNHVAQSVISSTLISQYVDEILRNENINIDYLPDSVEKAIYKNVLRLLLLLIDKVGEKTTIDLFGHKLRVIVTQ